MQEFRYDRFGNRKFNEQTTTTLPRECGTAPNYVVCPDDPKINPSANPNNNKLTCYSFDAAGNTKLDAESRKFFYDAENKQTKVITVDSNENETAKVGEYWYDGDGRRIKKRAYTGNVLTEETIFVYDAAGNVIGEYSNEVASLQDAKVAYLTNDHLGSPRINTDVNGNVTARHDYHPFGEEVASSKRDAVVGYADDSVRKQFTGYERDEESALDFAEARYYKSQVGRFSTPDDFTKDSSPEDPQSWNKYVFVRNNPLNLVDPSGEKATITINTDKEKKIGTIVISASFGVYAQNGNYSQKELQKHAAQLKSQIESSYKDGFKLDGITYTVSAAVTTQLFENETQAIDAGKSGRVDNIVGLRSETDFNASINGGNATTGNLGLGYNVAGEDFDRMVIATGSGSANLNKRNTFAHEFGHLMGGLHHTAGTIEGLMRRGQDSENGRGRYLTSGDFDMLLSGPARKHVGGTGGPFSNPTRRSGVVLATDLYRSSSVQVVRAPTRNTVQVGN